MAPTSTAPSPRCWSSSRKLIGKGREVTLKAVTGVSIGAINAACVVGAINRTDARRRISALWNDLVLETPMFWPWQIQRDLALYGLPNFYTPRPDLFAFSSWTHLYDTQALLPTLARHINFKALNESDTALVITAVDVESGVLKRFSNRKLDKADYTTIEPHHVLASGSLPPQFPWTDIKDKGDDEPRHYWDGGIVDNTPLGDAIDAFSVGDDVKRILVVMNLFPQAARLPGSLLEVTERVDQLRFGNRLQSGHQDGEAGQRPHHHHRRAGQARLRRPAAEDRRRRPQGARLQIREDGRDLSRSEVRGLGGVRLSRFLARGHRTPQDRRPRHGAGEAPVRTRIATS